MPLSLLLDEMIEHEVLYRLEKLGHDVEHVDFHDELNKGDSDRVLAEYSLDSGRIVVTYDSDWVENLDESEFHCVLLFDDETLPARSVSRIIHNIRKRIRRLRFRAYRKRATSGSGSARSSFERIATH